MKKLLTVLLALVLIFSCTSLALADEATITISGDGVTQTKIYTYSELAAMSNAISQQKVTSINNWPTSKTYYIEGVSLEYLLKQVGLKTEATTITVATAGSGNAAGYNMTFLISDLLATRYCFNENGTKTSVVPQLSLKISESGFTNMDADSLRFIYGQLDATEQTNPQFVQDARTITVTCAAIKQLPQPTASVQKLSDGRYSVTLASTQFDAKVYYTLDGSTPTVHSKMFNISAERWQPEINVPFTVSGNTTVKAIAMYHGMQNSPVYTFTPTQIESSASGDGFDDVSSDHWAATEIAQLVQLKIIDGMGDNKYQPQGNLTRAQYAKVMVLAINGTEPKAASGGSFKDVAASAWYAKYVEEAARLGLLDGYEDGTFRPNNTISRQEMLAVAVRALPGGTAAAQAAISGERAFSTTGGISSWAAGYVEYAYDMNLLPNQMLGMKAGLLDLNGKIPATRAEAAYVTGHFYNNK